MALNNPLEEEIAKARQTVSADGYPMSIGELTNLFRDGELIIRPEFQRLFRWTDTQKSRLVESILLGIPLPSLFVSTQEQGKWEVVDGLQRVSTILQLQGLLPNKPPLKLLPTKYLPHLDGLTWDNANQKLSLSDAQKRDIKRTKLDLKIIKRESSPQAKFDLFQRLNSYGSTLKPQEIRTALLVALSPEFLTWVQRLALYPAFIECVRLNEKSKEEQYDLEIVLRFLVLHNRNQTSLTLSQLRDFTQVMDDESLKFAETFPANQKTLESIFKRTFDAIEASGGEDVFRRWSPKAKTFTKGFLITSFEVFGLGVGYCVANNLKYRRDVLEVVKKAWSSAPELKAGFATGKSTEARLATFIPMGRRLLQRK